MRAGIVASSRVLRAVPVPGGGGGSPEPSFTAEGVVFDGTSDVLSKTSQLSNISDGKVGLISCWVYRVGTGSNQDIFLIKPSGGTNYGVEFRFRGDDKIQTLAKHSIGSTIHNHISSVLSSTTQWYHILCTWDLGNSISKFYIDDSDSGTSASILDNSIINYEQQYSALGARQVGDVSHDRYFDGELSEFYFTDEYLDITVESNRRKFISATGEPVDLGSDGSTPTGSQPIVYFKGAASVWNAGTNAGSGGNFSMIGSVTDSSNEPVEL